MWTINAVIVCFLAHSLNAQQRGHIRGTRGDGGDGGEAANAFQTSALFSDYNYTAQSTGGNNKTRSTDRESAQSSRDSFGNTHVLAENQLRSHSKEGPECPNSGNANDSFHSTHSSAPSAQLLSTDGSTVWSGNRPSGNSFDSKLFDVMSSKAQDENLVYSPISMQTLLAFIFTVSGGKLHEQLAQLLALSDNRTQVAKIFGTILQAPSLNAPHTTLIMANKLYYDYRFGPIAADVRQFAKHSFASELEQIDFFASETAASTINSWVSRTTRNIIRDIVTPSAISGETSALLLNSLYFKGEWSAKFATYDTETQDFFVTRRTAVPVNMMYNEDVFRYGDFVEDLEASVVELPYKASNMSMMLILPKDLEGLTDLERKLRYYDFASISQKLKREIVTVKLPRFEVEYEVDMIRPLQKMGLTALFNNAGSINLFKNQGKPLQIDQFKHKSFVKVNEAGTEAAAATVAKYIPLSIPNDMKYFVADHPFVFVIRNSNATFFVGHVVRF